ncbi:MAG: arsenite methyltransferase [Cyclobacteriaceae bacterium]|nr:arsenite methyltransferase [Cyclobacteriaceae bacterium]
MQTNEELKRVVREAYGQIATQGVTQSGCCSSKSNSCCGSDADSAVFSENYSSLKGYNPEADFGLGCGLPTEYAHIKEGDTVVDLGSGAGNDCFVARYAAGPTGKVIGVDMTAQMVELARKNALKLGLENVEFRLGEIEHLPVRDEEADVVVSNCVLNLVPDKEAALGETFRILKKGGHFSVSDIVTSGPIPEGLRKEAALYAGCVSGAMLKEDYLKLIEKKGFINVKIQKEQTHQLPDELLNMYLNEQELLDYKKGFAGILSITVYAEKPGGKTA